MESVNYARKATGSKIAFKSLMRKMTKILNSMINFSKNKSLPK